MVCNAYSQEELSESSDEGGKMKYRGVEFVKNALSPTTLNKITKSAQKIILGHFQDSTIRENFERQ